MRRDVDSAPEPLEDVRNASALPARRDVVIVASGKGGVGTSTVAALLALGMAREDGSVLIVDADGSPGSLPLLLNAPSASGLLEVRGRGTDPRELVVPVAPDLAMIAFDGRDPAGRGRPSRGQRSSSFRRLSSLYDEVSVSVVDAGSRLDTVAAACSAGAGRLITVTDADRVSVAANYALLKTLETRFPGLPLEILVNRRSDTEAHGVFSPLRTAVDYFLHRSVRFTGAVPEDDELRRRIDGGESLQDVPPGSPASRALRRVAGRIITEIEEGADSAPSTRTSRERS